MEPLLSIAEVAKRTDLSVHTLRYYERIGLIATVHRAPGGQRRYAESDLDWIGFLLRLRETGMPIGQMQAFAKLRGDGNSTAPQRRQMLEAHLAHVLASIKSMQRAAKALQTKIEHYQVIEGSLVPHSTSKKRESHVNRALRTRPRQTARD